MLTEVFGGQTTLTIEEAEKMQRDSWFALDGFPVHDGKNIFVEWLNQPKWNTGKAVSV